LDHTSPPSSSPPAAGLVDALPATGAPPPPWNADENPAAPPCPVQPPSIPRGVSAGRTATPPHASPSRGDRAERAQRRLVWAGWATVPLGQANGAGPRDEMSAQRCAVIFQF
jgi:hypothetical protein